MDRGGIARRAAERVLRSAARDRQIISLAGGLPARELFPSAAVTRAVERALSTSSSLAGLQYGWPEGEPMLREWVARRLNARGACISAEDVVITAGAQQAVAIALHHIVRRGAPVYAGAECYAGALDLLRSLGADLVKTIIKKTQAKAI